MSPHFEHLNKLITVKGCLVILYIVKYYYNMKFKHIKLLNVYSQEPMVQTYINHFTLLDN